MALKRLSILICSITKRTELLHRLLAHLKIQMVNEVEVIIEIDNQEMTIGEKRNKLLLRAMGDYVAFIDDDDLVSDDYISKILTAIKTNPDCCSLQGEITRLVGPINAKKMQTDIFKHSIEYDHWFQNCGIYYRCPNHLNAIKRSIALQVGFTKKNCGEDQDFSMQVLSLLKTEGKIDGTIYHYYAD